MGFFSVFSWSVLKSLFRDSLERIRLVMPMTGQTFQKKVVKFHIRRNDWNSGGITKEKKSQMSSMNEQDLMREFVRETARNLLLEESP